MNKQKLIFVVDDDPIITKLVVKRFASENYHLETFDYGEDCLKALNKKPDLIILDYYFYKADQQVMNGMEVFDKIKENLDRGVKEGIYRDDLSLDLVTLLYIEKLDLSIKSQFPIKEKISQEKVFKVVFENHIRGISNPKGIEYFEKRKEFLKFKI